MHWTFKCQVNSFYFRGNIFDKKPCWRLARSKCNHELSSIDRVLKEKLLYLRYENLNKTYIMQAIMKKQQNIIIQKQNHNQKT